ncbi:hypothetical protein VNO78_17543 [Psophocarpus tetragonolobus]|uniref:Uncharacterized protein n=1 Tax=Psophocarpus tetragonolobus TaxID=3891 RepID=A0AAN9XL43_PSOTE
MIRGKYKAGKNTLTFEHDERAKEEILASTQFNLPEHIKTEGIKPPGQSNQPDPVEYECSRVSCCYSETVPHGSASPLYLSSSVFGFL